jgi:hypothetical protein
MGLLYLLEWTTSNDIQPVEVYTQTGFKMCTEIWKRLWNVHHVLGQTTYWMQNIETAVKVTQRISFGTWIGTDTGMMGFARRWVLSASSKNCTDFFFSPGRSYRPVTILWTVAATRLYMTFWSRKTLSIHVTVLTKLGFPVRTAKSTGSSKTKKDISVDYSGKITRGVLLTI